MANNSKHGFFKSFAKWTAAKSGSPVTFVVAVLVILVWAVTGPVFGFNDSWQLVINTGTTIVTFLMVFLIQNTQNRDSAAVQLKLDELIFVQKRAHNAMLDLEELDQEELEDMRKHYEELAAKAREASETSKHESSRRRETGSRRAGF